MEKLPKGLVLSAGLFLCVILVFSTYHPAAPAQEQLQGATEGAPKTEKTIDDKAVTEHWVERITAVGGIKAYKEFAAEAQNYEFGARHVLAHLFGKALYQVEGLNGVSVCDTNYSYGCFHQFLGEAIAAHGLAAAATLNEDCKKQDTSLAVITCQHGIGHGVLAYSGYTEKDLLKALDTCGSFSDAPLGGCYSGAFMEYNVRLMISKNLGVRDYSEMRPPGKNGDFKAPCNTVDALYRPSCVLLLPQWWDTALLKDDHSTKAFAKMGDMCHALAKDIGLGGLCFQGLGLVTGTDPQLATSLCTASSQKPEEQLQCRAFSAHFTSSELGVAAGLKVCEGLKGKDADYCASYAQDQSGLFGANLNELIQ